MKRNIIITELEGRMEFNTDTWQNNNSIDINDIQKFLREKKDLGATHVQFNGWSIDGCVEEVSMYPVNVRVETDKEFNNRIHNEGLRDRATKANEEAKEVEQYERLKRKYG